MNASTGIIGGTPTAAGTTSFTVRVTDNASSAQADLSITVSPTLTLAYSSSSYSPTQNGFFSTPIPTVSGGAGSY
ncbi:putative Ig domain-containing protein, partial [Proteus mirabilis]|uniref:putative Ig domain-containing protein n=1 Tax=Proteus mirabilis TaxID=584 RepID=UPI0034D540E8